MGSRTCIGLNRYAVYVFDYGAPVGLRLALKHPDADHGLDYAERQRVRGRPRPRLRSDPELLAGALCGEPRSIERASQA